MITKDEEKFLNELCESMTSYYNYEVVGEFDRIVKKLSKRRQDVICASTKTNKRNPKLHSLRVMLSRARRQGDSEKVAELEAQIKEIKQVEELGIWWVI